MIAVPLLSNTPRPAVIARDYGRRYSLLGSAIGLSQVVVSQSTAVAHSGALVTLLRSLANTFGLSDLGGGVVPTDDLAVPALTAVMSCMVGGIFMLIVVGLAARFAARDTGSAGAGMRAGMLTATYSGLAWIGLSLVGTLLSQTDGFLLSNDPFNTSSHGQILLILVLVTVVRGLLVWGFSLIGALICASLGGEAGASRARR